MLYRKDVDFLYNQLVGDGDIDSDVSQRAASVCTELYKLLPPVESLEDEMTPEQREMWDALNDDPDWEEKYFKDKAWFQWETISNDPTERYCLVVPSDQDWNLHILPDGDSYTW
jgi:hypothetical protein